MILKGERFPHKENPDSEITAVLPANLPSGALASSPWLMTRPLLSCWRISCITLRHTYQSQPISTFHMCDRLKETLLGLAFSEVKKILCAEQKLGSCLIFSTMSDLGFCRAPSHPSAENILYLNGENRGIVNNLCFPATIAPSYAPPGQVQDYQITCLCPNPGNLIL